MCSKLVPTRTSTVASSPMNSLTEYRASGRLLGTYPRTTPSSRLTGNLATGTNRTWVAVVIFIFGTTTVAQGDLDLVWRVSENYHDLRSLEFVGYLTVTTRANTAGQCDLGCVHKPLPFCTLSSLESLQQNQPTTGALRDSLFEREATVPRLTPRLAAISLRDAPPSRKQAI